MNQDEKVLRDRFNEEFSNSDPQTVTVNKTNSKPDTKQVWWSFRVERGTSKQVSKGMSPEWLQLGNVYVDFHIPRNLGGSAADADIEKVEKLFKGWRSADYALLVEDVDCVFAERPDKFVKTVLVRWRSTRRQ